MLSRVQSCAVIGLEGALIEVELDISNGLQLFQILALADLRKEGPAYDLPIAIGILVASQHIMLSEENSRKMLFLGELSLDGTLRHTNGILPMVALASEKQVSEVFVPASDAMEAALVKGV